MRAEHAKAVRWAAVGCAIGLVIATSQITPGWSGEELAYNIGTLLGGGLGGAVLGGLLALFIGVFGR